MEIANHKRPAKDAVIDGAYHGDAYDLLVKLQKERQHGRPNPVPSTKVCIRITAPASGDLIRADAVNATEADNGQNYYAWEELVWDGVSAYEAVASSSPGTGLDYREEGYARARGGFCPIGAVVWGEWSTDALGNEELVFDAPQVWPALLGVASEVDGYTATRWGYKWTEMQRVVGGWDTVEGGRTDESPACGLALNGLERGNPTSISTAGMIGAGVATPATGDVLPLGEGTIVDMSAVMLADGTLLFQFYKPNTIGC